MAAQKIIDLSNFCQDVQGGNTANGTPIVVWDQKSSYNKNQLWYLTDDGYIESFLQSNKCLDTDRGLLDIGTKIVLMDKNDNESQKWNFDRNTGMITSKLNPNMCIARSVSQNTKTSIKGSPIFLWNKNAQNFLEEEWKWNLIEVNQPIEKINLSYKIFVNPVTGLIPQPDIITNIQKAVKEMNQLCENLSTSFRFQLFEDPLLIGGPDASGHVNFWFNTNLQLGGNLKQLDIMANSFFNPDYPTDQTNCFSWRPNAVNIYMSGRGYGGVSLLPGQGNSIGLCIDNDFNGVSGHIHELGHFFGLLHTHESNGMFNDLLLDNKSFNSADEISYANFNKPLRSLDNQQKKLIENTWSNIMSYHGSKDNNLNIFTKSQLIKWDVEMIRSRYNVLR